MAYIYFQKKIQILGMNASKLNSKKYLMIKISLEVLKKKKKKIQKVKKAKKLGLIKEKFLS